KVSRIEGLLCCLSDRGSHPSDEERYKNSPHYSFSPGSSGRNLPLTSRRTGCATVAIFLCGLYVMVKTSPGFIDLLVQPSSLRTVGVRRMTKLQDSMFPLSSFFSP